MYNKLKAIWRKGIEETIKAIIERKKTDSAEKILFEMWSDTMQKIFDLTGGEEIWNKANKEEKLEAFNNRTFSFDNFQSKVIEKIN